MALYLSERRIKEAVIRIGHAGVPHGRLFDFLIIKRMMKVTSTGTAQVSQSNPVFVDALDQLGLKRSSTGQPLDPERPYFNVFDGESKSKKYVSNGTNTTLGGAKWTSNIVDVVANNPRTVALRADYLANAPGFFRSRSGSPPKLTDVAVWYFRDSDVDSIVGGATTDDSRMELLVGAFTAEVGLDPDEVAVLFDSAPDLLTFEDAFDSVVANPVSYLPDVLPLPVPSSGSQAKSAASFRLTAALAAKQFVILTGPSGTGKSQTAIALAEAVQEVVGTGAGSVFALVAVGPDWTSPKKVLGFKSPFGKSRTDGAGNATNETYEVTAVVRLLLRASGARETPHFLIFDEMNLSHVERYFAPFLSFMEAGILLSDPDAALLLEPDEVRLALEVLRDENASSPEANAAQALVDSGAGLRLPRNVHIIGTVNVDETTYMFSPKVLDRAHVIELESTRPSGYLGGFSPPTDRAISASVACGHLVNAMTRSGTTPGGQANQSFSRLQQAGFADMEVEALSALTVSALDDCYDGLVDSGFGFGFRVSREVIDLVVSWIELQLAMGDVKDDVHGNWLDALDAAILQKVLPKLHGNRRTIGQVLEALTASLSSFGQEEGIVNPFPRSVAKLRRMKTRLESIGHVSFVG